MVFRTIVLPKESKYLSVTYSVMNENYQTLFEERLIFHYSWLSLNRAQGEESVEFSLHLLKVSENNLENQVHVLNQRTLDETQNQPKEC